MGTPAPLRFVGGRFTVEFSADATTQAHALEWAELQRVQGALYELASQQGWVDTGRFGPEERTGNQLRVDGCLVRFELELERNTVRVTAVERAAEQA